MYFYLYSITASMLSYDIADVNPIPNAYILAFSSTMRYTTCIWF